MLEYNCTYGVGIWITLSLLHVINCKISSADLNCLSLINLLYAEQSIKNTVFLFAGASMALLLSQ